MHGAGGNSGLPTLVCIPPSCLVNTLVVLLPPEHNTTVRAVEAHLFSSVAPNKQFSRVGSCSDSLLPLVINTGSSCHLLAYTAREPGMQEGAGEALSLFPALTLDWSVAAARCYLALFQQIGWTEYAGNFPLSLSSCFLKHSGR